MFRQRIQTRVLAQVRKRLNWPIRHTRSKMGRIGMTTPTRIHAAATSATMRFLATCVGFGGITAMAGIGWVVNGNEATSRSGALSWAFSNAGPAFERSFRSARDASTRYPVCRVTTLRSRGSADTLDFGIYIEESCDGKVQAELILESDASISEQLARARLDDEGIELEAAVAKLKFVRHSVPVEDAHRILKLLERFQLPMLPDPGVALDARTAEISSRTSYRSSNIEFVVGDQTRTHVSTTSIIDQVLRLAGSSYSRLHFESTVTPTRSVR